jgi:ATP adenylyltransferase
VKHLWAPWRLAYIKSAAKETGCFFCSYIRQKKDEKNLILCRGKTCFCIINKFPYNTGHIMIVPMAHKGKLSALTNEEVLEMWSMVGAMQDVLDRAMRPHGYNLGINIGRMAGAGVPGHVHIHIVPRWTGDTNYMPITGGTKVMPIALGDLYKLLRRTMGSRKK